MQPSEPVKRRARFPLNKKLISSRPLEQRLPQKEHPTQKPIEHKEEELQKFDAEADLDELVFHAELLYKNREHNNSKKLLIRALQINPHHFESIQLMGMVSFESSDFDVAANCAKYCYILHPLATNGQFYAECLEALGHLEQAREIYCEVLSFQNLSAEIQFECLKAAGNLSVRLQDFDFAEEFYNKAFGIDPRSSTLLVNLGTLNLQKGDLEGALTRFREALSLDTLNINGWVGLALVHREYGDLELSYANLERAMDIDPYHRVALTLLTKWALEVGKSVRVIERVETFLERFDQDVSMILLAAKIYYVQGWCDRALLEVEKVLQLDPSNQEAPVLLDIIEGRSN